MKPDLSFQASGALLLTGAYALLEPGGMGIAFPWPPRVDVSARPSEHWQLTVRDAHGQRGLDVTTVAEVAEGALPEIRPQDLSLDFGAHPATSTSAILAIAIAREATPAELWDDWPSLQRRALALHHTLQGGLGSGYDVLIAGLRRPALLERPKTTPSRVELAPITHRVLAVAGALAEAASGEAPAGVASDAGIRLLVAQHNTRVPTRHLLRTYRSNRERSPERVAELVAVSRRVANEVARALEEGQLTLVRAAFAALPHIHETLQALLDGQYINANGRAGLDAARELGIAATPSGAGADTLVALHDDPERLARLDRSWSSLGFHTTLSSADWPGSRQAPN